MESPELVSIPELALSSGGRMPVVGMGTANMPFDPEKTKLAVLDAIEIGYRHFDTAAVYGSEGALGEAIAEALRRGLAKSRSELVVTSKLWCTDAQADLVLPALRKSLGNLQLDYIDLYLIHLPLHLKPGQLSYPVKREDILPFDSRSVWEAMEECQRLGLTKSIGVSNFSRKKIEELLKFAKIPPAVNQVEMSPVWQQSKMRKFCAEKGIILTAYAPLGGQLGPESKNLVMESEVLKEIAKTRGKTVAQVSLRWLYERGVSMTVKSFKKERLKQNIEIFDWKLSDGEHQKFSQIPQGKVYGIKAMLPSEVSSEHVDFSDFDNMDV